MEVPGRKDGGTWEKGWGYRGERMGSRDQRERMRLQGEEMGEAKRREEESGYRG